ncbi:MAG: MFS transporter, partial [Firmicutes bacterium]|nr:MFS transporter [Bacillota bacterium]
MRKWLILFVVILGMWMDLMDLTIVNIGIPAIEADFHASLHSMQYVLTSYMITIGIFEPVTAYWADTKGLRKMYLISLVVFSFASFLDGMAWNLSSLIIFRIMQGIGGAMVMPLALSIVSEVFPVEKRSMAVGMIGLPLLIAPALGPTIGGWLVQFHSWRYMFWINIQSNSMEKLL